MEDTQKNTPVAAKVAVVEEKKPLIGIPGFQNSDKMFGVTGQYMQWANKFGDIRIIMPHEEFVKVDLLILPGGLDLSPSSYKAIPSYKTGNHDVFKEFFFKQRLKNYLDAKTPIFGICLGFQMLNVALGGTLTQHLTYHPTSSTCVGETAHEVDIHGLRNKKGEKLKPIKVNSRHHQAVLDTDLAQGLEIVASFNDPFDGFVVEAFKHVDLPIAGTQWHPEDLHDELSEYLVRQLLKFNK